METADRLWTERGFDAVTVNDLCHEAGVSKGLFYFYFASKDHLLVGFVLDDADAVAEPVTRAVEADLAVEQVIQQALAVMVRRAGQRARHLLARGIAEWFAAVERHASLAVGHTTLHDSFVRAITHGQARGEIDFDHDPQAVGGLLEWALLRAELEWATSTERQPALLERLWSWSRIVLRGVRPA